MCLLKLPHYRVLFGTFFDIAHNFRHIHTKRANPTPVTSGAAD